jgi:hypothetical protein
VAQTVNTASHQPARRMLASANRGIANPDRVAGDVSSVVGAAGPIPQRCAIA